MPDKEKHHDYKPSVDEQIEKGIEIFRKKLAVLKKNTDAASVKKAEELQLQIRRLKAARFLRKRQMENL